MMTPERWQQIKALLQSALEREPNQRSAFLAEACAQDESLRKDVDSFIISHEQAGDFIEAPAFELMAESLTSLRGASFIGQPFGPYKILEHIGAGGMGDVYLAEDERLGRKVALKILPAGFTWDNERVRRFQQEARAASALNHPNILTIFEIGEIDSRHFIATEFIEGETLRQHMVKSQMKINEVLDVAVQVASALMTAHQAGIAHRDIKPENIMLRRDGFVKVVDFGVAKLTEPKTGESEAVTLLNTKQGTVIGTAHYMSPEQARGLQIDARTDIWSLGVVLYEMVAGSVPFKGATSSDVIASVLDREPTTLARFCPEVPNELEWIVKKALRKHRDERYQTIRELMTDLKSLARKLQFEEELARSVDDRESANILRRSSYASSETDRAGAQSTERQSRQVIDSLAILPMRNESGDPGMEYFSDGITESIINALSQLPGLRVVARSTVFRYKGLEVDPQEVGQRLGARAVLTGRVRQAGDELMIAAELIDVTNDSQLWGEHYNRKLSDIFDLQEEISGHISETLRLKVSGPQKKRLMKRHTKNTQAYELYLKGRFFWNKRTQEDTNRGIECFQQALSVDPNFALAFTGLADCQIALGDVRVQATPPKESFLQGQQLASRALELDDALAEAHGTLGHASMHLFDWPRAEKELRRALELNPNCAQACVWQAYYLAFTGQFEDSITSINCALQLDPLALPVNTSAAELLYFAGRFDESIDQFHKSIEMDAHYSPAHLELARVYEQREMYDDALAEFAKARELSRDSPESLASLAHCYAVSGATTDAQKLRLELTEMSERRYVSSYDLALIHHGLGQKEECFEWLNRAYEICDGWMIYLTVDPRWQSLHSDARFSRIVRRVGLAPIESFPSAHSTETAQKSPRTATSRKRTSRKAIKSLAILPFMNTGADPNMDYLSDGITETIINALSQLPKLRVVARNTVFRYKGREVESKEVGLALGVQAVLTGRVHQVADSLIIGAELVDVESDSQLWGESYNRRLSDIFEIQAEIAKEIAETLRLKLSGEDKGRLTRRYTENAEAYQLYLKGRYHWSKRTIERLQKGLECFQQAIAIDPNYALAYAGISDCYAFRGDVGLAAVPSKEAFSMAKQAAIRALQIDDTLAEAYVSLAHANMHCFEWPEAEAAFKSAIKFNANHAQAHQWYAFYLLFNGMADKAIAEARRGLELDPLSLTAQGDLGQIFHYARRYDQAINVYQKLLDLEPNRYRVYLWLGLVYEQKRKYEEAIAAFQKARSEDNTEPLVSLGSAYALSGRTEDARNVLKELNELSASRYVSPYQMSVLFLTLGDESKAFEWLEKAYEQRAEWMIYLSVDPRFDRLRKDSRFTDLLERIGFQTTGKAT